MSFEEYPKMLTEKHKDGSITPVYYSAGHEKCGQPVIFENAGDEEAYQPKVTPKATPKAKPEKAFNPMKD